MTMPMLPSRALGSTGLSITTVGFGAWAIGGGDWAYGWGPQDDAASLGAMRRALDLDWPGVTGAIVGARLPAQVDGWIGGASLSPTPQDLDEIAAAITRTGAGKGLARP